MNITVAKRALIGLALAATVFGCAEQAEDEQTLSGKVALETYSAPVVGVRAVSDGLTIATAPVAADGSFELSVPPGDNYVVEVVTRKGAHALATNAAGKPQTVRFSVCQASNRFELGTLRRWGVARSGGSDSGGPGDPTNPCDPNDPTDPPPPCDPANPETCTDPGEPPPCPDPNPDGTCNGPTDPPPPCDPADPNCEPPPPCDPANPDGSCGCTDPGDPGEPPPPADPNCPDGSYGPDGTCDVCLTDPNVCWPEDPQCPYSDPACWTEPTDPCQGSDANGEPVDWTCFSQATVPENVPPNFGCDEI